MDVEEAIAEFAELLLVGSTALSNICGANGLTSTSVDSIIDEVRGIAGRLADIGHELGQPVSKQTSSTGSSFDRA